MNKDNMQSGRKWRVANIALTATLLAAICLIFGIYLYTIIAQTEIGVMPDINKRGAFALALAVLFSLGFGAFAGYLLADAKNGFARVRRGRKKFIFFGVVKSVLAAGLIVVLFAQGVNALFIAAAAISAACAVPDFMAARQIGKENAAAKEKAET